MRENLSHYEANTHQYLASVLSTLVCDLESLAIYRTYTQTKPPSILWHQSN